MKSFLSLLLKAGHLLTRQVACAAHIAELAEHCSVLPVNLLSTPRILDDHLGMPHRPSCGLCVVIFFMGGFSVYF